jgi:hypothetical protein
VVRDVDVVRERAVVREDVRPVGEAGQSLERLRIAAVRERSLGWVVARLGEQSPTRSASSPLAIETTISSPDSTVAPSLA